MKNYAPKKDKQQTLIQSPTIQPKAEKQQVTLNDNRSETVMQQRLVNTVNNSDRVTQLQQYQEMADNSQTAKANQTGLPLQLKSGIENLSGYAMDDVKVHYNSDKPAQLKAHAYAQGTDIHLASGQEKHLPHEAWHVVQQKQGRVKPTLQMKGKVNVNDDKGLEREADVMGAKALNIATAINTITASNPQINTPAIQLKKSRQFDLSRSLAGRIDIPYTEYKDLDADGYRDFVNNKLERTYNWALGKGLRDWDKFQQSLNAYEGGDVGFMNALKEKRSGYDEQFNKNYVSNSDTFGDSYKLQKTNSSGLAHDGDEVDRGKDIPYQNQFDFRDNSISGIHNYAERDMAREEDKINKDVDGYETRGLPNSEILWQQYRLAAKAQFSFNKTKRAKALTSQLTSLKRRQVVNGITLRTLLFALPDGLENFQTGHTFTPNQEEFYALLGTPNCNAAAHILADHVDELDGKSIIEIELLAGPDNDVKLDIKFGKL